MGCANSKEEEPPLVVLCRERRDLIRAAADHRFALAAAHVSYFRALDRIGDALQRFVQEELVPVAPSSPVLTLPPSEGKGIAKGEAAMPEIERSVEGEVKADGRNAGSGASSTSFSSDSHLHLHHDTDSDEIIEEGISVNGGSGYGGVKSMPSSIHSSFSQPHPHFYGRNDGNPMHSLFSNPEFYGRDGGGVNPMHSLFPYPQFNGAPPIPSYYYMKKSATVPTTVYQNPYPELSNSAYVGYGYGYGYGYPMYGTPGKPAPVQYENFYQNQQPREEKPANPPPSPPPPPPKGSAWDFLDPFNSYEQLMPGYLQDRYGVASVASSPQSSEVREREGIPDLEEETEQESMKEPVKGKKMVDEDVGGRNSVDKSSTAVRMEQQEESQVDDDTVVVEEKETEATSRVAKAEFDKEDKIVKKKRVSLEEEVSMVTEDSGLSKGSALAAHGTRDVMEVVSEIKEQFRSAASCGEEVSRILEVGKLHYRSRNKVLRVILSKILDAMVLPTSSSSKSALPSSQHLGASLLKVKRYGNTAYGNCIDFDPGKLSATLEKLYMWEKKLYKEVKDEEQLRVICDKEWDQLKALDASGAESWKIDSTRASIRRLVTKLNVVIRSAGHISRRIHKLRDEELQPQLTELIQGLVRMWRSILECHHKQLQAIVDCKSHNLMPKTGSAITKVTMELEMELLNWCSCFSNWIQSQRAYIKTLNGWLMKWLLKETEETPDGVIPFSPSRIGAPSAFIMSNDWYHIIDRISAMGVIDSMQSFAVNVQRLGEMQDQELQQKLKAEYLSKDFARRLRSLQKENGIQGYQAMLDKPVISFPTKDEDFHDSSITALDATRKRVDEERAKHIETINHVQQATAGNLQTCLLPIFEALERFSLDNLKGYEAVRISNGSAEI